MKKALVVGINDYPSAPLRGCINDATDLSFLLGKNEDESANFDVRLKTNVGRKGALLELIAELFAGESDMALFYFSGHGFINELGGYLVTPDHRKYDEGISMNDLLTLANKSKIKNKIIILDCCHSGAIAVPDLAHHSSGHINDGIAILTASRQEEVAIEVHGKGVFTNLLLEAMKGGASDLMGNITPGGIYAYIDRALGAWDQRPIFKTNVSRFTSIRNANPKLSIAELKRIMEFFPTPSNLFQLNPSFEYTNDPSTKHDYREPYAIAENTAVFKALQKLYSVGLVVPMDETHMYWAAMNGKSCQLTPLGAHYWRLVKEGRL